MSPGGFSGGTLSDLKPGEERKIRADIDINDSQAAHVDRVEFHCSSRVEVD